MSKVNRKRAAEMTFGGYLRGLRGNRSYREFEKVTGLSNTYLSTIEKGFDPRTGSPIKPSPDVLRKLSDTLSVPFVSLLIEAGYLNVEDILDYWRRSK